MVVWDGRGDLVKAVVQRVSGPVRYKTNASYIRVLSLSVQIYVTCTTVLALVVFNEMVMMLIGGRCD